MKRNKVLPLIAGLAVSSLLGGCGKEIIDEPIVESTQENVEENTQENETENEKGEVVKNEKSNISKNVQILDLAYNNENIMLSPTSLNMALGMLTNGTAGDTRVQLEEFLQSDIDSYNNFTKNYMDNLGKGVNIANSVWVSNDYNLRNEFSTTVIDLYNAKVEKLDFLNPESVGIINNWVDTNTDGRIPKVLNVIPDSTTTILINVVDFDKQWKDSFKEYQITEGKFEGNDVIYLNDDTNCIYYENDYATGFARRYEDDRYSFVGILPKQEGEFNVSDLDIEGLLKTGTYEDVIYKFPEFEFEFESSLNSYLKEVGVNSIFNTDSDFSNLFEETGEYYVSEILQKTKVIVNREGTKASASTTIIVTDGCAMPSEPKQVYLDRPFVFVIYDNETNECLFIGKVVKL